jgi:hypothetical protein
VARLCLKFGGSHEAVTIVVLIVVVVVVVIIVELPFRKTGFSFFIADLINKKNRLFLFDEIL